MHIIAEESVILLYMIFFSLLADWMFLTLSKKFAGYRKMKIRLIIAEFDFFFLVFVDEVRMKDYWIVCYRN